MKTLQNNFTTPEQSKRLLELGVPADSADETFFRYYEKDSYDNAFVRRAEVFCGNVNDFHIPCWSAGRLMEIFDMCYQREPEECITEHWILTQEAAENFGSYIEYLVQTFSVQKNYLDFSKLDG